MNPQRILSFFLLSFVTACTLEGNPVTNDIHQAAQKNDDSVQIELSGKQWTITTKDLGRIKGELLTLLEQREPDELNERLIDELHKSALKIYPDNTARIGGWKLIVRDQALLLQCLAVLHENFRLYYEADLAIKDEHWQAVQIRSVMVRRHGL